MSICSFWRSTFWLCLFSLLFFWPLFYLCSYIYYFPSFTVSLVCQPYLQFKSFTIVSGFVAWDTLHQYFPTPPLFSLGLSSSGHLHWPSNLKQPIAIFYHSIMCSSQPLSLYDIFVFVFLSAPHHTCLHMRVCICACMCMHIP